MLDLAHAPRQHRGVPAVVAKEGRSGSLCFVTVRHDYETSRGLAIRERQDIVYREAAQAGEQATAPKPSPLAGEPDRVREVEATTTLLFRYSAMTFNGHRFHYDYPYTTKVEGYPGLVVHGPIQASLLFNLAAETLGCVPGRFRYRSVSPMIAGQTFRVAGQRDGDAFAGVTRTTHPVFMRSLQNLIDAAGLRVRLVNPYILKTKGEMLSGCADRAFLLSHAGETTSCGHYARTAFTQCGRCVPCLIRRASFHAAGIPDATPAYKYDISLPGPKHRDFENVRAAAMAVGRVEASGLKDWLGGALNAAQLGADTAPYEDVAKRGIGELGSFLRGVGVI